MELMSFIFGTLIEAVFWVLIEVVGYTTARLMLPLLSFGRLYVEPPESSEKGFNAFGYRRDESGRIEVEQAVAGGLGLVICFVACLLIVLCIRALV